MSDALVCEQCHGTGHGVWLGASYYVICPVCYGTGERDLRLRVRKIGDSE